MTMTFEHWSRVIDQLATGPGGRTVIRGKRFPVPRVHKKKYIYNFWVRSPTTDTDLSFSDSKLSGENAMMMITSSFFYESQFKFLIGSPKLTPLYVEGRATATSR